VFVMGHDNFVTASTSKEWLYSACQYVIAHFFKQFNIGPTMMRRSHVLTCSLRQTILVKNETDFNMHRII